MGKLSLKQATALAAFTLLALALTAVRVLPVAAQNSSTAAERWFHVSVTKQDPKGERVRVNLPFSMAESVLGAIKQDRLDHGIVRINDCKLEHIDFRKIYASLKTARDGEFVTVESASANVRVAKENGFFIVKAHDINLHGHHDAENEKTRKDSEVYIRVPLEVVDALFSGKPDELNILAALHALAGHGDTELVSVKDSENSVRVWIDTKSAAE